MTNEPTPRQGWTWQEGIDYEVTLEIIGEVIGVCSGKIGEQRRSTQPDQKVVEAWQHEIGDWVARRYALRASDTAAVAALRDEAVARRNYLRLRTIP